jgi:serine/threonine-protein kinase PknK
MITLIVEIGPRRDSFTFADVPVSIGRGEDNDLRIGSRFISQHHCRVESLPEGGYKLVDLGSQNGTLVNGAAVSQTRLRPGDHIDLGPVRIWVQSAPEESTAPLAGGTEEATQPGDADISVAARNALGARPTLVEGLREILRQFRKDHGDERGLVELEHAVVAESARIFPRPAFHRALQARRLVDVARSVATAPDLQRALNAVLDAAVEITDSERGFLVLREESGQWKVRVARNFDQETVKGAEHKISRNLAEQVARTGRPICSVNAVQDPRLSGFESVSEMKLRSVMCVPLSVHGRVIGTLYLDNRFKDAAYTEVELSLLEAFADHAALAIENARLYEANMRTEAELARRRAEIDELALVLDQRQAEAVAKDAEAPRPMSRSDLRHDYGMIIGESPAVMEMLRLLDRVIDSDLPILISGESGTGKELIAEAVHRNSSRRDRPFVKENCAAIPESLLESELFGYKRGAFTGAHTDRSGLFSEAHEGTIFLDEIGEMSMDMQSKLLRVLQDGEIRPVGGRETRHVDVRVITASNRDLRQMVKDGRFREDLFFRLNVVAVRSPPLRERLEDVPLLVEHFLAQIAARTKTEPKTLDPLALRHLVSYHWPGNVRELLNELQRAVALSGPVIGVADLSPEIREGRGVPVAAEAGSGSLKDQVKLATYQKEREIILRVLEESSWRKSVAARRLRISRPTLDQKIRTFGLEPYVDRGRQRE